MNDPKQVILNLSKRWLASYGETLGTEEIRRHLSRMLSDLQRRELEQVFANWSGEELLEAIGVTFDMDDGAGCVREKVMSAPSEQPLGDTEYLPYCDTTLEIKPQEPVKRKGRPPGAKNKYKVTTK